MLHWEAAGTNLALSRRPQDVLLENFAVLRKVGSSSLTDEDGLGWEQDGWTETEASNQTGGNLHHPSARPGVGSEE